jgi:hypothetical protein
MNLGDPLIAVTLEVEMMTYVTSNFRSFLGVTWVQSIESELKLVDVNAVPAIDSSQTVVIIDILERLIFGSTADMRPASLSLLVGQIVACLLSEISYSLNHFCNYKDSLNSYR